MESPTQTVGRPDNLRAGEFQRALGVNCDNCLILDKKDAATC